MYSQSHLDSLLAAPQANPPPPTHTCTRCLFTQTKNSFACNKYSVVSLVSNFKWFITRTFEGNFLVLAKSQRKAFPLVSSAVVQSIGILLPSFVCRLVPTNIFHNFVKAMSCYVGQQRQKTQIYGYLFLAEIENRNKSEWATWSENRKSVSRHKLRSSCDSQNIEAVYMNDGFAGKLLISSLIYVRRFVGVASHKKLL